VIKQNKNYSLFLVAIMAFIMPCLTPVSLTAQNMRKVDNNAFEKGEQLDYKFYYDSFLPGYVTVGDGTIEIRENNVEMFGRNTMHIAGTVKSRRFFSWFFRVDNRYETYIDEEAIVPWYFMRDIYEGGYERKEETIFDHNGNKAYFEDKKINTTDYIQDVISAFYFARTFDFSSVQPGDEFDVSLLFKDSIYTTKIIMEGRETIKTDIGEIKTMRFKPEILQDSGFKQPWPMTLWISDDENSVPVLFESRVIVGYAKMELTGHKGLKHPLAIKKRD